MKTILSLVLDGTFYSTQRYKKNLTPELLTLAYWFQGNQWPVVLIAYRCIQTASSQPENSFYFPLQLILQHGIGVTPITAHDLRQENYYRSLMQYEHDFASKKNKNNCLLTHTSQQEHAQQSLQLLIQLGVESILHVDNNVLDDFKNYSSIDTIIINEQQNKAFKKAQKTLAEKSGLEDAATQFLIKMQWNESVLVDLAIIRYLLEQNRSSAHVATLISSFLAERFFILNHLQQQDFLLLYLNHMIANINLNNRIFKLCYTKYYAFLNSEQQQALMENLFSAVEKKIINIHEFYATTYSKLSVAHKVDLNNFVAPYNQDNICFKNAKRELELNNYGRLRFKIGAGLAIIGTLGAATAFLLYCAKAITGLLGFAALATTLFGMSGIVFLCSVALIVLGLWLCAHIEQRRANDEITHHLSNVTSEDIVFSPPPTAPPRKFSPAREIPLNQLTVKFGGNSQSLFPTPGNDNLLKSPAQTYKLGNGGN